jgi:hypothetical protein
MKFLVVKKLFVLVLSIAVGLLTNSYARNDRKGGHSSGFAHAAGGHGGGRRGTFAGRSGGHAVHSVHLRMLGGIMTICLMIDGGVPADGIQRSPSVTGIHGGGGRHAIGHRSPSFLVGGLLHLSTMTAE